MTENSNWNLKSKDLCETCSTLFKFTWTKINNKKVHLNSNLKLSSAASHTAFQTLSGTCRAVLRALLELLCKVKRS